MSGRIWVAMCITIVPSAWNADAIAIRSSPERSSAHDRISRGCASSNRVVQRDEFVGGEEGLQAGPSLRLRKGVWRRESTPDPFRMLSDAPDPDRKAGIPPCPTSTRSRRTAEPSSTCSSTGAEAEGLRAEAANLPKLVVSDRELADLEMLAVGALSPLTGFQGEADYHSILDTMHLTNGLPWSIPVTLSVDDDGAHRLGGAAAVALTAGEGGEPLAVLRISEIYSPRQGRRRRSRSTGRTTRSTRASRARQRRRRQVRRRRAPGHRAPAARRLPAVPA